MGDQTSPFNGDRGVVYVTTGARYLSEAVASARTVRKLMPDLPILLYTDQPAPAGDLFAQVIPLQNVIGECLDKIEPLLQFPFKQTLFLDGDTVLCEPCYELFDLLDRYELLAATEPARHPDCYVNERIPVSFGEVNTGVMVYRDSENVRELFANWLRLSQEMKIPRDQAAFRDALYLSPVRFWTISPEYNFRADYPGFIPAGAKLKILHARKGDLAAMRRILDSSSKIRITLPGRDRCKPEHFLILSDKLNRFVRTLFKVLQKTASLGKKKGAR